MNGAPQPSTGLSLRALVLAAGALTLAAALWAWAARGSGAAAPRDPPRKPFPTRLPPEEISRSEADREAEPVASGYRREVERPKPVQNPAESPAAGDAPQADLAPGGPASRRRDEKRTLPEIFCMPPEAGQIAQQPQAPGAPAALPGDGNAQAERAFAPFGRLLRCQLVETLDSVTARSEPIVALVTSDLDWNGEVVIPAGTEAFGYANPQPAMDAAGVGRLVDTGEWTLVLPGGAEGANGRELVLKARALDRLETAVADRGAVGSWGPGDGVDGLVGVTLSSMDDREIKLFAAAAISGMAQGIGAVAQRQVPAAGIAGALGATQVAPTVGNAVAASLGAGATEVMNQVAGRIREEISRRGVYVRVPSGKAFYLFVEQTIDPGAASVGARLPPARRRDG